MRAFALREKSLESRRWRYGAGLAHDAQELESLKLAYRTHVHADTPLPQPTISLVQVQDKQILYFSIGKGNEFAYLTSDGKCLKRLDLESIPVGAEKIQGERLELASRIWDRAVEGVANLDDLDLTLVQQVSNQIAYGVTAEKCLQHLGLAEFTPTGLKLKAAALLLFAKDVRNFHPGCFVRIFTISGKDRRSGEAFNVVKDDIVADNLVKLVETAWERLSYALTMHTSLTDKAKFQQSYLYPQIACREALINAIVHRNYAIQGRGIEISIFSDRLELLSPGRLLSTISLDDIRKLRGAHESRNPLVARMLREIGYVREMGEGIRRIFDVMRSNALAEPDIQSNNDDFIVTLYHRSLYDPRVKLWLSLFEEFKLSENQAAVLALGFEGREFSTQDIIDRLGIVDTDQVREILTPLRNLGLVVRTKNDAKAISIAKARKIPKRAIPMFKVVGKPSEANSKGEPAGDAGVAANGIANEAKLHLSNINFNATLEDIVAALEEDCTVLSVTLLPNLRNPSRNRGYADVVVQPSSGNLDELIARLQNLKLGGRILSVRLSR
jgi:ATP-dependent DNA helicase RecG